MMFTHVIQYIICYLLCTDITAGCISTGYIPVIIGHALLSQISNDILYLILADRITAASRQSHDPAVYTCQFIQIPGLEADVSRIPAGVISGIGFLGAGSILVTGRNQIKGLTTAASLWVCAAMGLVIGAGYLLVGIVCFALIMIANRVLQNLSVSVEEHSRYISIYLEVEKLKGVVKLRKYISETGYELVSMNKTKEKTLLDSDVALTVVLDMKSTTEHQNVLDAFNNLDYVNYLEEI